MAEKWTSITVELLGRPGAELWPHPGRVLAVGDDHSFAQLGQAIHTAFGRWGPAKGGLFHLPDGRMVGDTHWDGAPADLVDDHQTVAELVEPGAAFRFLIGRSIWVHSCRVGEPPSPSAVEASTAADVPVPYDGWGDIPDPDDRRWPEGETEPERPGETDPMLTPSWPSSQLIQR